MTANPDLWHVRKLPGGLVLELRAGDKPGVVLVQGDDTFRAKLSNVKSMWLPWQTWVADLAGVLAGSGVHHA